MTTDEQNPLSRLGVVPTFRQPTPPPTPDPETTPTEPAQVQIPARARTIRLGGDPAPDFYEGAPARPARPPTETSSDGDVHKPTPAEAAALMVGLLGIVITGAAFLVRLRTRRKLREPSKQQTTDIASPLGRILLRHADLTWLGPDIADGIKAAAATGAYLNDGPLLLGEATDPGIPDDLQEDPQ